MLDRAKLTLHLHKLDIGIRRLLASPAEAEMEPLLRDRIRACALEAIPFSRDEFLAEKELMRRVLTTLLPATEFLEKYSALEKHKNEEVRRAYETFSHLLIQIELLGGQEGYSFQTMNLTKRLYTTTPWVSDMLEQSWKTASVLSRWSESQREKLGQTTSKLMEIVEIVTDYTNSGNSAEAYEEKIKVMTKIAEAILIKRRLPQRLEKEVHGLWMVLEKHAPPPLLKKISEKNQKAQCARGTYFYDRLPEQLKVLEEKVRKLEGIPEEVDEVYKAKNPAHYHIVSAFDEIETLVNDQVWRRANSKKHVEQAKAIMAKLEGIMTKLDFNVAIAQSEDPGIQKAYEGCWCLVHNIGQDASKQYKETDPNIYLLFPKHPFLVELDNILTRMSQERSNNTFVENIFCP